MEAIISKVVFDRELLAKETQHRRRQLGLPAIIFEEDEFRREIAEIIQTSPGTSFAKFLAINDNFMADETRKMIKEAVKK
ncbi:MAG: hypothetical protein Q7R92_01645 [bacterium]|nr:hypothetical protein [bacterium]